MLKAGVGGRVGVVVVGFLAATTVAVRRAPGATIPFGAGNGGVAVYYNNNGGGENPANIAWLQAQFSVSNINGAEYNFDATPLPGTGGLLSWYNIFQAVPNQYGFDLVLPAPTNDNSRTLPALIARNNVDGNPAHATPDGQVDWAIDNYTGPSVGPSNPADTVVNTHFRGGNESGASVAITSQTLVATPPIYTLTIAGTLQ